MAIPTPARERIEGQLRGAIEQLRNDMDRVEFWTDVLGCLTQPIPDYDAGSSKLDQFSLPRRASAAPRNDTSAASDRQNQTAISPPREPSNTGRSTR